MLVLMEVLTPCVCRDANPMCTLCPYMCHTCANLVASKPIDMNPMTNPLGDRYLMQIKGITGI